MREVIRAAAFRELRRTLDEVEGALRYLFELKDGQVVPYRRGEDMGLLGIAESCLTRAADMVATDQLLAAAAWLERCHPDSAAYWRQAPRSGGFL